MPKPRPSDLPSNAPWPLPPGIVWNPYGDGSPRFQVFSRAGGVKKYVDCDPWFDNAVEMKRVFEGQVEAKRQLAIIESKGCRLTLREGVERWISTLVATGFPSASGYERSIRLHVVDAAVDMLDGRPPRILGDVRIDMVSHDMILNWRDGLKAKVTPYRKGHRLAASTINTAVRVLSSAFTWFVKRKLILPSTNPMIGVERLPEAERPKTIVEQPWQITELLRDCFYVGGQDLFDVAITLFATGWRISDALYIRREHVRLDANPPSFVAETKGRKLTESPIFDALFPVFERRMEEQTNHSLLFPGDPSRRTGDEVKHLNAREVSRPLREGEVALRRATILDQWRRAIAVFNARHPTARLPPRMRLHDVRHTFGTHWVEGTRDGRVGDIRQLQSQLGHADIATTDIYARKSLRAYAGATDRMGFDVPAVGAPTPRKQKLLPPGPATEPAKAPAKRTKKRAAAR